MELAVKDEAKPFGFLDSEEDALLNEAICCSRNLEIEEDEYNGNPVNEEKKCEIFKLKVDEELHKQMKINDEVQKQSISWADMESSDSSNNLSASKSDLSTSGIQDKVENGNSNEKHAFPIKTGEAEDLLVVKDKVENDMDADGTEGSLSTNTSGNTSPVRKRMRDREDQNEHEIEVSRTRSNSYASSSTLSNHSKKNIEYETDPAVLARRQKDVDYGKNTIGYDKYSQEIPKDKRLKEHPRTPPMYTKCSRRAWDGMVKTWRKQLHLWDPKEDTAEKSVKD